MCEWIDGGVGFDEIPSEFIRRLADAYLLRIHIAWKHPRLDRRATRCAQYALALYRGLYGATSEHVGVSFFFAAAAAAAAGGGAAVRQGECDGFVAVAAVPTEHVCVCVFSLGRQSCLTLWQRTSLRLADEQPAPSFAVRERLTRYELVVADWIMRCRMLRREPWQFIANLVQCVAAAEREIRMLAGAFPAPAALFAPLLSRRSSSANTDGKSSTSPSTSEPASEAALREKQPSGRSGPTGEASLRDAASARRLAAAVAVCRLAKRLLWRGFVGAGRLVRAGREQRVTVRGQTLDAWIDWVITDAPTGAAWLKTGDAAVLQALADAERHVDGRALTDPVRLPKLAALRFSTGCVHSRARRWRAALGPLRFAFALMVHIPPRAWTRAGVARIAETGARLIEALYAVRSHDAARDVALRASLYVFWPLPSSATIQQLKARAELLATGRRHGHRVRKRQCRRGDVRPVAVPAGDLHRRRHMDALACAACRRGCRRDSRSAFIVLIILAAVVLAHHRRRQGTCRPEIRCRARRPTLRFVRRPRLARVPGVGTHPHATPPRPDPAAAAGARHCASTTLVHLKFRFSKKVSSSLARARGRDAPCAPLASAHSTPDGGGWRVAGGGWRRDLEKWKKFRSRCVRACERSKRAGPGLNR